MNFLISKNKNDTGFTLIEILVVVVILGILFAISFSIYESILQKSKSKVCETNIRAIKHAKISYFLDNQAVDLKKELTFKDLAGHLKKKPTCPYGGNYYYGTIREKPKCSHENLNLAKGSVNNAIEQKTEAKVKKNSIFEKLKKTVRLITVIIITAMFIMYIFFPDVLIKIIRKIKVIFIKLIWQKNR